MYYAVYKGIRDSAWKCLLDFHLDTLPIDVLKITRDAGIHVIRNSMVNDLLPGERGKAYYNGIKWIIIYDDLQPTVVSRFTVAHELGHIFLGHELQRLKYADVEEFKRKPKSEQQADQFALRLLCPACVLCGLDLHSPDEISEICRVPHDIAKIRAERMELLYERNKFLISPLEREVYENFEEFIKKKNQK